MAEDDNDRMFKLIKNIVGYWFAAVIFTVVVLIIYAVDYYW
tara:strand:+ start:98 stop:220 length:123 start_codon:yes stop_codon:yes gene_type:complete